ncbi:hypothetical protein M8J75_003546 [Diaphorina citri]|nr:hypothetical protein M8J75_003546 [Diaphorina citri]
MGGWVLKWRGMERMGGERTGLERKGLDGTGRGQDWMREECREQESVYRIGGDKKEEDKNGGDGQDKKLIGRDGLWRRGGVDV